MVQQHKVRINHERKRPVRTKTVKVTLFDFEYELLESKNPFNSVAKLMRESALKAVSDEGEYKKKVGTYTKLDRSFVLELSRVGTNINQIARAINTDLVVREPLDAVKLLHLLIGIDETLKQLRESVK